MIRQFLVFSVILFLWGNVNSEIEILRSKLDLEPMYIEAFINKKPWKNYCHFDNAKKLAICNKVISIISEHQMPELEHVSKIYFSKTAAYYNNDKSIDCINNKIKFTLPNNDHLNNENIKQDMIPCYGRNEPMRTNWNVDDHYNRIFISVGPEFNSVFVYKHIKVLDGSAYEIFLMIKNENFITLPRLKVSWSDIQDELHSLNTLSVNKFTEEIEINYVHEFIKKTEPTIDPVCNLLKEHKILLCKDLILENTTPETSKKYIINEKLFDIDSLECQEKVVEFSNYSSYSISQQEITKKMYPCHIYKVSDNFESESIDNSDVNNQDPQFYLSGGYRPNSVLMFELFSYKIDIVGKKPYKSYLFFENIRKDYFPFIEVINEPIDSEMENYETWFYFTILEKLKAFFTIY